MITPAKNHIFFIFIGDIIVLYISLWVALVARYFEIPKIYIWNLHFIPFTYLFFVWILVFFIVGLYEQETLFFKERLPSIILKAQFINVALAAIFFYFIPYFNITPKTNLFLYLFISSIFIFLWRKYLTIIFGLKRKTKAILIGKKEETKELSEKINNTSEYAIEIVDTVNINELSHESIKNINNEVRNAGVSIVGIDYEHENARLLYPILYKYLLSHTRVVDLHDVYENVFERVPAHLIEYQWFLRNVSSEQRRSYDIAKRSIDIVFSLVLGIMSLVLYPLVYVAIALDDGGSIFIKQKRIGQKNKHIFIYKFRSMNTNDNGKWVKDDDTRVTRIGKLLRKMRIDEAPQLWNVLKGDLSFIGPRPDIIGNWEKLSKELSYYSVRNMVKPGLSGWAQIKQATPPQSLEETKMRLMYDFYYIKNRSLLLDFIISLKTIRTLLSRSGI